MASLASFSSSSVRFFPSSSNFTSSSLVPLPPRSSLFSSSSSYSPSFSASSSSYSNSPFKPSRRIALSGFTVRAIAAEKKNVLIVNTNSGGHAVIGFYFAKQLLNNGHGVTIMTVGEEASDKMKKPPFNRFSVKTQIEYLGLFYFQFGYCHCKPRPR